MTGGGAILAGVESAGMTGGVQEVLGGGVKDPGHFVKNHKIPGFFQSIRLEMVCYS